jgi:hypothetical protein
VVAGGNLPRPSTKNLGKPLDTLRYSWLDNDMSNTAAHTNWINAKAAYEAATTNKARRDAAEDIEFWGNKMAAETISERSGW